jgi:hypothetical protein
MATLKEVINEIGEDYMALIREGSLPSEIAADAGYRQCWQCDSWENQEEMATSGGNGESELCEYCFRNSHSKQAKEARKIAREVYEWDGVEEPKRKKRVKKDMAKLTTRKMSPKEEKEFNTINQEYIGLMDKWKGLKLDSGKTPEGYDEDRIRMKKISIRMDELYYE